ncbi:MAG: hypothetical protein EOO47_01190 [Flavobacterium sp.]|nr:MAG: hypothetical protein EOO47_01190 [Flavobacterium sp.]
MTTRKVFKIIGIFIAVIIALILLFFAFVWGSIEWNRYSKKKEANRMQKEVCDTITTVQGNFEIKVSGFTNKELKKINFYLQRDKLIVRDTTINFTAENDHETQTVMMPFAELNIKDQIIVVIKNRTYLLSGFKYLAYYNYGMFGPVGPCQCGGSSYQNVNGKPGGSGWLLKKEGLLNYQLPPK